MSGSCLSPECNSYLTAGAGGRFFAMSLQMLSSLQCMVNEDWPKDATKELTDLEFDYIVVGAGTAGSIVATRLSENSKRRVLLIESGGDPPFESQVPNLRTNIYGSQSDWEYKTQNETHSCLGMVEGRCKWLSGKSLGGSSISNGMIYVRGNPNDYDNIEAAGNFGWNYKSVLRYFKMSENLTDDTISHDGELRKYHGFNGPLGVKRFEVNNPLGDTLIKGYNYIGIRPIDDINGPQEKGVFKALGTVKDGRRESTAKSFLLLTNNRTNLVILKNAVVSKLSFQYNRAKGVYLKLSNGTEIRPIARREVILSAGAVATPQLLILSGIGPASRLKSLGIPVMCDLPVGANLHDHPMVPVFIKLNKGALPKLPLQDSMDISEYLAFQRGTLAEQGIGGITAFTNIDDERNNLPNIQYQHRFFEVRSQDLKRFCEIENNYNSEICKSIYDMNQDEQLLVVYVTLLNPESRGRIEVVSKDPNDKPRIYSNYFTVDSDVAKITRAIREIILLAYFSPEFKNMRAKIPKLNIHNCNELQFRSTEYWRCYIENMGVPGNDPMGTVKMGPPTDPSSVVNSNMQVHTIQDLRVVDSSIIPSTIRGNINAPVMMIAEKAAEVIELCEKQPAKIKSK